MLYNVVLTFQTAGDMLKCDHSNLKAIEKYLPVMLFIMMYKVVLTVDALDETPKKCDHSNESY